ncbi:hypothetical protein BN946_scf184756.g19 [Trametes cinnabarina]|uniref:Telomerase reverse transcriptase n=1 Tax=Pycnoporus cinnabarinus TaxID=5643 RepID=A0A060S836_PYCCI|nr:hypothetical protein BN946_scf184756.g19 [Trametes cinnabarina]
MQPKAISEDTRKNPGEVVLSILRVYYPLVQTLQEYLYNLFEPSYLDFLILDGDSMQYKTLVMTSYVASVAKCPTQAKRFVPSPPMSNMRDVIDRAQEKLFLKSKGSRPSSILTAGYRKVNQQDGRTRVGAIRVPLVNYFVNTIVTALQAPEWESLLNRIGEEAVFHLLTETSIFVSLPNGCLCQVTGDPIVNIRPPDVPSSHVVLRESEQGGRTRGVKRRLVAGFATNTRSTKRRRLDPALTNHIHNVGRVPHDDHLAVKTAADIIFLRARMFYARPAVAPHTSKIVFGLSPKHILNRLYPSWLPKSRGSDNGWVDPDPRQQFEYARHLAKYVFPRQYNLSSPFDSAIPSQWNSSRPPHHLDREHEIKSQGSRKTPKRLKAVLNYLEKMIWRHRKCRYKSLLDLSCPSKRDSGMLIVDSLVTATYSDGSVSLDSAGRPLVYHTQSQARKNAKFKPKFAEFICGVEEVYRYAVLVTKAVIPRALWGSDKNFNITMENVKHMITGRRYESFSLHRVLQDIQTSDCEWLMPPGQSAQKQTRVSVTDALKRRELLEEFLYWYFDSFIIPLLKTTFYITESSAFRNRVLYFRHDDWNILCAPLVEKLSMDTFQRIEQQYEAQEILRQRRLGFSFVRLLPKETGVRPIVNLRRRVDNDTYRPGQSINQILQAAFQILTYEKDRQPERLGASVFGPNEVYAKLKAFKNKLTSGNPSAKLPKLYFVKVDVQACFDTIEQTKLLEILRELLVEDAYMLQRYGAVSKAGDKIQRRYVKKALPEDDHPHFLAYAAELAQVLRNTVFTDQVVYPFARRKEIIALLEEHITENIVKIKNDYYRQVVGIPQGSVLSALLCSFFYGDLERSKFRFTEDDECILMRLIDDWLLITTNRSKAMQFYDMVSAGHPEYGCFIAKDKSLLNFDHPELVNIVDPRSKNLQDSLTVDFGRRPGAAFSYKMMQLAKSKSHIIYNDAELNSAHALHLNVYQSFLVLAMKMHYYLREWKPDVSKHHAFILKTIRQSIRFAYKSACIKARHKLARTHNARVDLYERQVIWLGLQAFHTVLSRKPYAYTRLLKVLSFELSLPRYRNLRKRFRPVIAEGLSTLTVLSF